MDASAYKKCCCCTKPEPVYGDAKKHAYLASVVSIPLSLFYFVEIAFVVAFSLLM